MGDKFNFEENIRCLNIGTILLIEIVVFLIGGVVLAINFVL